MLFYGILLFYFSDFFSDFSDSKFTRRVQIYMKNMSFYFTKKEKTFH